MRRDFLIRRAMDAIEPRRAIPAARHLASRGLAKDGFAGIRRRTVLASLGGSLLMVACEKHEPRVMLAAPRTSAGPATAGFMRLSQVLTGHQDLDMTTATRLTEAFARVVPEVSAQFAALGALVRDGMSAPELLAAATAAGLRPAALALVAAWYTGTVGKGTHALTVSYREALMQRPVADALTPPTYAGGGPAWWTAPPPDAGLPARVPQAATTAAAAGSAP
jgi:hypothetical protein